MKKILPVIFVVISLLSNGKIYAAGINLKTDKTTFVPEENFKVDIVLSGGENNLGTDVIILFDPQYLLPVEVKEGTLYSSYQPGPDKRIDPEGKIILSGSSGMSQEVKASGLLGTVAFKALQKGKSTISFDYAPQSTNKTQIVDSSGYNLLAGKPQNLDITIGNPPNFIQKIFSYLSGIINKLFMKK